MPLTQFDIPLATSINYLDADEICGYQLLLCKMFESEGGFQIPAVSNRITALVGREGSIWLRKVKALIKSILSEDASKESTCRSLPNLGEIPRLLYSYDFFHRVCNGFPCYDFIREVVLKSANRYVKGDKSLSQAQVALMLEKEADRDIRTMEKRYLTFGEKMMEKWIDSLEHNGRINQVSESDSYEILKYLLLSDLFAFGIKRSAKLRWIESHLLSDDELETLDTRTFWQYIGFDQAAEYVTGKSLEEQDIRYVSLFSRLAAREDLHPFFKEGLAIDLAKYKTA